MTELLQFMAGLPWEGLAVLLAIAYLLLAAKENILCWYCAFIYSGIYVVVFWDVNLLMESALNVYYVLMALVGWYQWRHGGERHQGVAITRLSLRAHILICCLIALLALVSGYLLSANSDAAWPYVDSFTTWASVITTVMVTRKILENWLYWIVIDAASMYLYYEKGYYPTLALFIFYTIMAAWGFKTWYEEYEQSQAKPLAQL
mgnify:CR=1 FL=1